ncbi:MAG: metallophosphoesterase family protein [Eubacteriales bacterium]|nr:metallophosphoesterase family protein [Eubacteriales bacterium]
MLIALVADLHGNRPATETLAKDLAQIKPQRVICLGDIVGKGPDNAFTFDWAMSHCDLVLGGNWDYGVGFQKFEPDVFYWEQLGQKRLQQLQQLPQETELWVSGRRVRLFHGRPIMDNLVVAHHGEDVIMPYFQDQNGQRYDAVIYADAHRQALRTMSPGLFVNIGSVGNAMGIPQCCYALLDVTEGKAIAPFEVRLRQLDYDRDQAVKDALAAPRVPRIDAYIHEIQTGIYSRGLPDTSTI